MAEKTKKTTPAKKAVKKTTAKKASKKTAAPVKRATTSAVEKAKKTVKKVASAKTQKKAVAVSVTKKKTAQKAVSKPVTKQAAKKAAAKQAIKKAPPKKAPVKKAAAKLPAKAAVKKTAVKKVAAKKAPARKSAVKAPIEKVVVKPAARAATVKKGVAPKAAKSVKQSAKSAVSKKPLRKAQPQLQDRPIPVESPVENIPESIPVPIRPFDSEQDLAHLKTLMRRRLAEADNGWLDEEDRDILVLMVKDPWWVFAYWNITADMEKRAQAKLSANEIAGMCRAIRVYDVTGLPGGQWPGSRIVKQIVFSDMARHWYIHTDSPGRTLIAEVGLLTQRGRFIGMVRSHPITSPGLGTQPGDAADPDTDYWSLFQMAVGYGGDKGAVDFAELFARDLSSASLGETLSSIGLLSSWSQDIHREEARARGRQFFLWLDAELIVYGGTDPQAQLSIMGQPCKLRPDGTFSIRMHLPNGIHTIPVEAISPDNVEKRVITPVVTRQTTAHQSFIRPKAAAEATR